MRQPGDSDRRTPFRDTERQRLAQMPRSGSVRGVQGRVPSPRGTSAVSDPTVSTPRVPRMQPARPTYVRNQEWRRQGTPLDTTPIRQDRRRSPGSQAPQRMESRPPTGSQPPMAQPRSVRTPETQPRGSVRGVTVAPPSSAPSTGSRVTRPAPSQRQVQPDPRRGTTSSAPERVIPRMIPRSRAESIRTAPPASVRQPASRPAPAQARPAAPRPSPAQARPSAPSRPSAPGRATSSGGVRGHGGGGGKPKGGKGDRD